MKRSLIGILGVSAGGVILYLALFAPLAMRMVGSWRFEDNESVTITTFKPDGEWESVTTWKPNMDVIPSADGSGIGNPLVFRGHYSTWLNRFRTYDMTRYVRYGNTDVLWKPSKHCDDDNSCVSDAEIIQEDKAASDPKEYSTIIRANWWKGTMTFRSSPEGDTTTWVRDWKTQQ